MDFHCASVLYGQQLSSVTIPFDHFSHRGLCIPPHHQKGSNSSTSFYDTDSPPHLHWYFYTRNDMFIPRFPCFCVPLFRAQPLVFTFPLFPACSSKVDGLLPILFPPQQRIIFRPHFRQRSNGENCIMLSLSECTFSLGSGRSASYFFFRPLLSLFYNRYAHLSDFKETIQRRGPRLSISFGSSLFSPLTPHMGMNDPLKRHQA